MAFPKRKLLGLIRDGWKDRGKVGSEYVRDGVTKTDAHSFCMTDLRVGLEEKMFLYCPKCLIKMKK